MLTLLIFGLTLLVAVLISELADRSVVSTAVLFLGIGFAAGEHALGFINLKPDAPVISRLADFALVAVLFTDGMKLGWRELRSVWRLPGRALFFGLPLTMTVTAVLGHYVAGLSWLNAWLVGAVLSPTDPVFAAAIVGRSGVSQRLRHLLNVESGLNDGLALPIVLGILALGGAATGEVLTNIVELLAGVAIGIALPWLAVQFERSRFFAVARSHEPFFPFAVGIVVFALAELVHANQFLAAFTAGVCMASMRREKPSEFNAFGEECAELLKLAALLVFGALISVAFLREVPLEGYAFAVLALFVARPVALAVALWGAPLDWRNKAAAMWFGPKGFASVIYGLMVLKSGIAGASESFHLIAIVIVGSIIAHSSTDVVMARWLNCTSKLDDGLAARPLQP
jgi:NhaP-type Na+/H+ or K+/H+ antiporter